MPNLLSGSLLRRGGSGEFIDLAGAQPQLPPTPTTSTGYSLVTNSLLQTSYRSSLGNIEFNNANMYSNLSSGGTIRILATGTNISSTSTVTGLLVVDGDIGVGGGMNIYKDIVVNGLTIGQGYQGINNIVIRGTATSVGVGFENGQETIAIGYSTLEGISSSYRNIGIGRYVLQSGTNISNNIGIGDFALRLVGTTSTINDSNIGIGVGAGKSLTAGQYNIFMGHETANTWNTGSYNIILGQLSLTSINSGSGIISIGGDNIVNGLDNQVNIGSVFYYDGTGYTYIASEVNLGLGTSARITSTGTFSSSSTMTGGLVVVGGIGVYDNAIIGSTATSTSTTTGAVVVFGGIGAQGDVYAKSGNRDQNYLLYSPSVTVSTSAPGSPRIGDIWIDDSVPAYLQYVKDGTSTFWIQVGAV
jgi:hypothetical protein